MHKPWINQPTGRNVEPCTDPEFQVVCDCGNKDFTVKINLFRRPGQVIGTFDVTANQYTVCTVCGEVIDPVKTKRVVDRQVGIGGN